MRIINHAGIALIKEAEGFRATAYQDTGGVWTIGFGHTKGVRQFQTCSPEQADYWLEADLEDAEHAVSKYATAPLSDNQFAALVSFTFNLGPAALQKLLAHGIENVPAQIIKWDHDNGHVIPGLTMRRHKEAALWSMK